MKKLYLLVFALFLFSGSFATVGPIQGINVICAGTTVTLSDTTTGGAWSSSDTLVAIIDSTGTMTGLMAGTTVIYYTTGTGAYDSLVVTVNVTPVSITGIFSMLVTDSVSLSDTSSGGIWVSSNTAIAPVDSTGVVQGLSAGTADISYTLTDGCYAADEITVYTLLTAITGPSSICTGSPATFTDTVGGGAWSSSDTAIATVDPAGIVTGVSVGTATITYAIDTTYVTQVVTINLPPAPIYYASTNSRYSLCIGEGPFSELLVDATAGGIWSSIDTSLATIDSSGVITLDSAWWWNLTAGVLYDTVLYTMPDGCSTMLSVMIGPCEGIPAIPNNNEISIFPNPATTQLTIQSSKEAITQVSITNVLGQVVVSRQYAAGGLQVDMDVSVLPTGVYFVQVNLANRQAGGGEVRKFVKE